jgi:hypothetical protein
MTEKMAPRSDDKKRGSCNDEKKRAPGNDTFLGLTAFC